MALPAQYVKALNAPFLDYFHPPKLQVGLASTYSDMRDAQRLRYQVFVEEMGAVLDCGEIGIESDHFDPYCQHLLVRDVANDRVVGCYRILTDVQAHFTGGYYSQAEFDMSRILAIPGRFMEVGRTCVHPDYRNGATIGLLWSGLARYMAMNKYDYLMGCASIPMELGTKRVASICRRLLRSHLSPPEWRVFPKVPVPLLSEADNETEVDLPPLLKGYMRMGAVVCGEPSWDPDFNVADLFVLLNADRLNARYVRHFVNRNRS
ncbi:MAG: GNAT family N-acyltransferase [Gammaproteobacteria bacterium]